MTRLTEIVGLVSRFLAELGVEHCLIGGMALAVHRFPRATHDIDFLAILPEDLDALLTAAAEAGLLFDESDRELAEEGLVFFHHGSNDGPRVDLLGTVEEVERDIVRRSATVSFGETEVPVIELEDLVPLKLAAARPRDDLDAEELLKRAPSVSEESLLQTARRFGVETKARAFLAEEE